MLFGLLFWAFSDCQVWEMSKFEADIWQSWSTRNFFVIDTIVQKWSAFVPKFKTRLATYISWELVMEDIQYIQYIFEDHDPSLIYIAFKSFALLTEWQTDLHFLSSFCSWKHEKWIWWFDPNLLWGIFPTVFVAHSKIFFSGWNWTPTNGYLCASIVEIYFSWFAS